MATRSWVLVPCLDELFQEFNLIAPYRDKRSDGKVGDEAHQLTKSDHNPDELSDALRRKDADNINEVHAIDVDKDLHTPGLNMEMVVQFTLSRCRTGAEKRLTYIIWNRRIWEASNSWRQRTYTGANAHDQHARFSASYDTAREASRASWHLEDIPMPLNAADKAYINGQIEESEKRILAAISGLTKERALNGSDGKPDGTYTTPVGEAALTQGIPNPFNEGDKRSPAHVVLTETARRVKGLTEPNS